MKTSFYFFLWILTYSILGLFNSSFVVNNAFIIALAIVFALSWMLNRLMPHTLTYERASQTAPILEDVYTCNVASFKKRLVREALIEAITAIYFTVTTIVIAFAVFKAGASDWIALAVFGFFTIGAISRSISLFGAKSKLKSNPTPEQCMEIAVETYQLDYASYYEARNSIPYRDMLPPRPRWFKVFVVFSLVMAAIVSLLGLLYIASGLILMLLDQSLEDVAIAGMLFLYGSLAVYFGVKDFISCIHTKTRSKTQNTTQSV